MPEIPAPTMRTSTWLRLDGMEMVPAFGRMCPVPAMCTNVVRAGCADAARCRLGATVARGRRAHPPAARRCCSRRPTRCSPRSTPRCFADPDHPVADRSRCSRAAVRRKNRANLVHWAEANVRDAGRPRAGRTSAPRPLAIARDLVRRGLDADALHGYRVGQNVAWRRWMGLAFELTSDPGGAARAARRHARARSSRSSTRRSRASPQQIERERDELTRGTHAQRLEVVSLILEGAPIARRAGVDAAGLRARPHAHRGDRLERASRTSTRACSSRPRRRVGRAAGARPLTVVASASALWVWVAGEPAAPRRRGRPGRAARRAGRARPDRRRASTASAAATSTRWRPSGSCTATPASCGWRRYDDVQVVALATARRGARATSSSPARSATLATAPAELRETAARLPARAVERRAHRPRAVHPPQHGPHPPAPRGGAAPRAARGPRPAGRPRAGDPSLARGRPRYVTRSSAQAPWRSARSAKSCASRP